jgi:hypothetical protein
MNAPVSQQYGLQCPSCRSDDDLLIEITCIAELNRNGVGAFLGERWSPKSFCGCNRCGHTGAVINFAIADAETHP